MSLLAGAATRELNPSASAPLFGYPGVRRMSTGVHDPILASALYLAAPETTGQGVVILSLDVLFLEPPLARRLRAAVAQEAGVPEACVFIGYTHTHSAPVCARLLAWHGDVGAPEPDLLYQEFILRQSRSAVAEARRCAVPAALAWTSAEARGVGGNRHRPDGVTDPECGILAVRPVSGGAPLATVLVYGMHPTVMHEDSTLISSDFPHYTRLQIRERFGAGHVTVYLTAPCGDQSPRWFVNGQTFAEAERLGRQLGTAALAALDRLPASAFASEGALRGFLKHVTLPRRKLPTPAMAEDALRAARNHFARLQAEKAPRAEIRTAECAVFGAQSALCLSRAEEQGVLKSFLVEAGEPEIQVLGIHGGVLVGIPGEIFVDYALDLKCRAGSRVFPVSLVNGELQGYICTPDAAVAGGYEAANSLYAPEAGPILVKAALDTLADLGEAR